jgi:hypothetical protein
MFVKLNHATRIVWCSVANGVLVHIATLDCKDKLVRLLSIPWCVFLISVCYYYDYEQGGMYPVRSSHGHLVYEFHCAIHNLEI